MGERPGQGGGQGYGSSEPVLGQLGSMWQGLPAWFPIRLRPGDDSVKNVNFHIYSILKIMNRWKSEKNENKQLCTFMTLSL